MHRIMSLLICWSILVLVGGVSAQSDPPPWKYSGLHGMPIDRLVASEQIGAGGGWVFGISTDGFHYHNRTHDKWISRVEPGVPGRAVTSLYAHTWNPDWLVIGRVDATGHGYIEHTTDLGETLDIVYQAESGAITAVHGGSYYDYRIWACSEAGNAPGELLYSDDGGLTWNLATGHGHDSLYDLFCWSRDVVYVAGNNGVVFTPDGGATWQTLTEGLPAGPVHHFNHRGPAVAVPSADTAPPEFALFAITDAGLHFTADGGASWTQVLTVPCRSVSLQYWPYGGEHVLVVTEDHRILWDENFSWQWEDRTNELTEASLRGGVILVEEHWVATDLEGVFLSRRPLSNDVPATPLPLNLSAAPNPFNPSTVLSFTVSRGGHAHLAIYDLAGRLVDTLLDQVISTGEHKIPWQPRDLASGSYLARLTLNGRSQTLSILLHK